MSSSTARRRSSVTSVASHGSTTINSGTSGRSGSASLKGSSPDAVDGLEHVYVGFGTAPNGIVFASQVGLTSTVARSSRLQCTRARGDDGCSRCYGSVIVRVIAALAPDGFLPADKLGS